MHATEAASALELINRLDMEATVTFRDRLIVEPSLTRQLVSFQANKDAPAYRWYKFKEAFSASLVKYILQRYGAVSGRLLDPFAGSGTALFAARGMGLDADGIELLPIGQEIIETRLLLEKEFGPDDFSALRRWASELPWNECEARRPLQQLRITQGAYPPETLDAIERYMAAWANENPRVQTVLRFALLCILEQVSYTRKDGQYLRWDSRCRTRYGRPAQRTKAFCKGHILGFDQAVCAKLREILADAYALRQCPDLFGAERDSGAVRLFRGSCLEVMPTLAESSYDAIFTSPPYCNRYDYTRTYALELAVLGVDEQGVAELRQSMVSCTVENRAKDLLSMNVDWGRALEVVEHHPLLQAILRYLDDEKAAGRLNNNGIPRMVRGYFQEMACVVSESWRVLRPGGWLFMVNDNVRYAGANIPVDIILSQIAEGLGFDVQNILVLPDAKGNSSQQMGRHGREPLRKCVYVWRKP